MIEAYAFLGAFTVQILTLSVLHPVWLSKYVRAKVKDYPDEYFAKFGADRHVSTERFVTRYRAAHAVIAVLGVLLLGWLCGYMQRPDWDDGRVVLLLAAYFTLQMSPLLLIALIWLRHRKAYKRILLEVLERKRKAVLQRRGLLDFVSPFTVLLAVLSYLLFAAFVMYLPSSQGLLLIGVLTLSYALTAFVVYKQLYGNKSNPFETHVGRVQMIGLQVRSSVYSCILEAVFFSFIVAVVLLDMKRWMPFATSVFMVITVLLSFMVFTATLRRPESAELGASSVP